MRIVLISPKGPLYRHRGGIFKKSLRYMPLTLTTLAALVPEELGADLRLLDEGIDEVDPERIERLVSGITRQLESAGEAEVESGELALGVGDEPFLGHVLEPFERRLGRGAGDDLGHLRTPSGWA